MAGRVRCTAAASVSCYSAATVPPPLKTNKRDDPEVSPSPSIEDLRGLVKAT